MTTSKPPPISAFTSKEPVRRFLADRLRSREWWLMLSMDKTSIDACAEIERTHFDTPEKRYSYEVIALSIGGRLFGIHLASKSVLTVGLLKAWMRGRDCLTSMNESMLGSGSDVLAFCEPGFAEEASLVTQLLDEWVCGGHDVVDVLFVWIDKTGKPLFERIVAECGS